MALTVYRVKRSGFALMVFLLLVILAVVTIFPFFWALSSSFKIKQDIIGAGFSLLPRRWTLDNYRDVFIRAPFMTFFLNSILVSTVATVFALITSISAGYVFAKFKFPTKNFWFILILGTLMMPIQVYVIPIFLTMKVVGLINTLPVLIIPWIIMSSGIFFLRQNIEQIPDELIDAARIDGCSEYRVLVWLITPLVKAAAVAIGIISFRAVWNAINDVEKFTVNLGMMYFQRQFTIEYAINMAAALISSVPPLAMFVVFRRQILENISLGGLKL